MMMIKKFFILLNIAHLFIHSADDINNSLFEDIDVNDFIQKCKYNNVFGDNSDIHINTKIDELKKNIDDKKYTFAINILLKLIAIIKQNSDKIGDETVKKLEKNFNELINKYAASEFKLGNIKIDENVFTDKNINMGQILQKLELNTIPKEEIGKLLATVLFSGAKETDAKSIATKSNKSSIFHVFKFHGSGDSASSYKDNLFEGDSHNEYSIDYNNCDDFSKIEEYLKAKFDDEYSFINKDERIIIYGYSLGVLIGNYFRKILIDKGFTSVDFIGYKGFYDLSTTNIASGIINILPANGVEYIKESTSNYKLLSKRFDIETLYCEKDNETGHKLNIDSEKSLIKKFLDYKIDAGTKEVILLCYAEEDEMVNDGMLQVAKMLKVESEENEKDEGGGMCKCCRTSLKSS